MSQERSQPRSSAVPSAEPVPTPITVAVDGNEYTEITGVDLTGTGVLILTDVHGWLSFLAPGSWGKITRVDDVELPAGFGGNPRNLP